MDCETAREDYREAVQQACLKSQSELSFCEAVWKARLMAARYSVDDLSVFDVTLTWQSGPLVQLAVA